MARECRSERKNFQKKDGAGLILPHRDENRNETLEIELDHELDNASARVISIRQVAIRRVGGKLPERSVVHSKAGCDPVARNVQQEVGEIENVEGLRAELYVGALADLRLFHHTDVPLLLPRSVQERPVAELACRRRSEVRLVRIHRLTGRQIKRSQRVVDERLWEVAHHSLP